MNQSTTFVLVMSGLILLFWVMGVLPENSINGGLLTLLTNPSSFQNSPLIIRILSFVDLASLAGIVLGLVVRNYEITIKVPMVLYLMGLMWDFVAVYLKVLQAGALIGILALLFFGPLFLMWVLTAFDYPLGRD